jgi:hypothetical protein
MERIHPAINWQEGKLNIVQPDVQLRDPDDLNEEPDQNQNAAEASTSASIAAETSARDEPTRKQITYRQTDFTTYIPKKLSSNQKKVIDKHLLGLFTFDFHLFSIVDDKGFVGFVKALKLSYRLTSRKVV